jgi:lincosamide nucleotidyltransferase
MEDPFDGVPSWIEQVAAAVFYVSEWATEVAVFDNALRGEFHFLSASEIPIVDTRGVEAAFMSLGEAIVVDRAVAIGSQRHT